MKSRKPIKQLARNVQVNDEIKVGGHLFIVEKTFPGYCDLNKVSLQLTDPNDPRGPITSIIIPGHMTLKVYPKKK